MHDCCNGAGHGTDPAESHGNVRGVNTHAHHHAASLPAHESGTHDKHHGHTTEMFLQKFWVSALLTVPVVLYSELGEKMLGVAMPQFPGATLLPPLLGSVVFFYGGFVFLRGAWQELHARLPGMMTLIALAVSAAYLWSIFAVLTGRGAPLFWELTTLITVMLLGHWLEMRAVTGAEGALRELQKLLPDTAERIEDNTTRIVPLSELKDSLLQYTPKQQLLVSRLPTSDMKIGA